MSTSRQPWRRGDGSAAVRGWVAFYTLGLPSAMRSRRRAEVAGDLADETMDAVRRGEVSTLRRRRLVRLALGIPADIEWRVVDAPVAARELRVARAWVPVSRWSLAIIAIVAIGAAGALAVVTLPILAGVARPDAWPGWGLIGFVLGCSAVLIGVLASVPWPGRGAATVIAGVVIGFVAAPYLWGPWLLAVVAVAVRLYQAEQDGEHVPDRAGSSR